MFFSEIFFTYNLLTIASFRIGVPNLVFKKIYILQPNVHVGRQLRLSDVKKKFLDIKVHDIKALLLSELGSQYKQQPYYKDQQVLITCDL